MNITRMTPNTVTARAHHHQAGNRKSNRRLHSGWRKSEARPEFQRLMADAADGKFEVVLVYHTSRFARNQVEARRYKQLLRERLGIPSCRSRSRWAKTTPTRPRSSQSQSTRC
jgi:hypothetical protein